MKSPVPDNRPWVQSKITPERQGNTQVLVRVPDELLARLDSYRGGETRQAAIRRILDGYLP